MKLISVIFVVYCVCVCIGVWNIGDLDFLRPRGGGVASLLED